MEKGYIVATIKKIISNGNTLEACNHIELVLRTDTEKFDSYILIKTQLNRTLNESLLGIISQDEKYLRINTLNHQLISFLSSLEDHHFLKSINPLKSDREILSELQKEHEEIQFSVKQKEAIYEMRLREKDETITSLIKEHREESVKLKSEIETKNDKMRFQNERISTLINEIERLKKIISEEYAKKKIWNK